MSLALTAAPAPEAAIVAFDRWAQEVAEWLGNFQSRATRATYRAAWADFLKWLPQPPWAVTRLDVMRYRDQLASRENAVKPATVSVRMAALASFYKQARDKGLIDHNPCEGVERPKVEAYTGASWLEEEEARKLLRAPDRRALEGKRDFAILVIMLTMGLRRGSVAGMRVGDVSLRGNGEAELRYKPKGGEDQSRPIPSVAWRAVQEYLRARGPLDPSAAMFIAHDRASDARAGGNALTGEAIRQLVDKHALAALGRTINPHALRHTCANAVWDLSGDLRKVQGMLGHASATTTELYLHRRNDDRGALGDALGRRFGVGRGFKVKTVERPGRTRQTANGGLS